MHKTIERARLLKLMRRSAFQLPVSGIPYKVCSSICSKSLRSKLLNRRWTKSVKSRTFLSARVADCKSHEREFRKLAQSERSPADFRRLQKKLDRRECCVYSSGIDSEIGLRGCL